MPFRSFVKKIISKHNLPALILMMNALLLQKKIRILKIYNLLFQIISL